MSERLRRAACDGPPQPARARHAAPPRHSVPIGPRVAGKFGPDGDCGVAPGSVYSGRPAPPSQARAAFAGVMRTLTRTA